MFDGRGNTRDAFPDYGRVVRGDGIQEGVRGASVATRRRVAIESLQRRGYEAAVGGEGRQGGGVEVESRATGE